MRILGCSFALLAGCAQISGLDSLGVDAATADAPTQTDASVDAPIDNEKPDVKDAAVVDVVIVPTTCNKPADCSGPGDVCCATLTTSGSSPNCVVDAAAIACKSGSTCPSTIPLQCGTEVVRLCKAATDCTEASYPKCCVMAKDGSPPLEFCMSSLIAQALGATCL